ncbi:MAG: hypothetical protein Q9205_006111 [Flavoplaca limonia]
MTTVVILEFTSLLDSEGRPSGEGAFVWNRVLRSISELSGWNCTKWGPQSNDKHRIVALIVWKFLLPQDDFLFSRRQPLAASSPLRPLAPLLTTEPRLLNAPFFPAPEVADYLLGTGTSELELIYLPQDAQVYKDQDFRTLFDSMAAFVECQGNRIDTPPWDFRSGHRAWVLEETDDFMPVHAIILHYESSEGERRFKDPDVAHEGMLLGEHPEKPCCVGSKLKEDDRR